MRFHIASYRNGIQILSSCKAGAEVSGVLSHVSIAEIERRRSARQEGRARKAGIQAGLNALLKERFTNLKNPWSSEVAVFEPDTQTGKGFWKMDFAKSFGDIRVGMEVTFNHAEALTWTLIRPTLAHESEHVLVDARINVGVIIIGTDHLKGRGSELRMDSAVGTYERLRTVLPKMRAVLPAPLVIFGLDWEDGGFDGKAEELDLHRSDANIGHGRGVSRQRS